MKNSCMFNPKNTFLRHTLPLLEKSFTISKKLILTKSASKTWYIKNLGIVKVLYYHGACIIMEAIISTYFDHFNLQCVTCNYHTKVHHFHNFRRQRHFLELITLTFGKSSNKKSNLLQFDFVEASLMVQRGIQFTKISLKVT